MGGHRRQSSISISTDTYYSSDSPLPTYSRVDIHYDGPSSQDLFTDYFTSGTPAGATVIDIDLSPRGRPAVHSYGSSGDILSDDYRGRRDIPPSSSQTYKVQTPTPKKRSSSHSTSRTSTRGLDDYTRDNLDSFGGKVRYVRGLSQDRTSGKSGTYYEKDDPSYQSSYDDNRRSRTKSKRRDSVSSSFGRLDIHDNDTPRLSRAYTTPIAYDHRGSSGQYGSSKRSASKSYEYEGRDRPSRSRKASPEPVPLRRSYTDYAPRDDYYDLGTRGRSRVPESRASYEYDPYTTSERGYSKPAAPSAPPPESRGRSPPRPPLSRDRFSSFFDTPGPSAASPKLRRRGNNIENFMKYKPKAEVETASEIGESYSDMRKRAGTVRYDDQNSLIVEEIE